MRKREEEVNRAIDKKLHYLWNQFLDPELKPLNLGMHFVFHGLPRYLSVCDNYRESQHKDSKQKWWNNQKASEMSNGFLPEVLRATDQSAVDLALNIEAMVRPEFTRYCKFELLETAILSVFSTQRSGSNEVFLRTSFQYSKSNLRKKLLSYFDDAELSTFDAKAARKKKDVWCRMIKTKKDKLLQDFKAKRERVRSESCSQSEFVGIHIGSPPPTADAIPYEIPQSFPMNTVNAMNGINGMNTMNSMNAVNAFNASPNLYTASPPILSTIGPRYQLGQALRQSTPFGIGFHPQTLPQRQQQYAPNMDDVFGPRPHGYYQRNGMQSVTAMTVEGSVSAVHPTLSVNGYGHHRMRQCKGCRVKDGKIGDLQRENMRLKQQYQALLAQRQHRRGELVCDQTRGAPTFALPSWPQTDCRQSI